MAQSVKAAEIAAFAELGGEAILRLQVEEMPLVVAYDAEGGDIFCI